MAARLWHLPYRKPPISIRCGSIACFLPDLGTTRAGGAIRAREEEHNRAKLVSTCNHDARTARRMAGGEVCRPRTARRPRQRRRRDCHYGPPAWDGSFRRGAGGGQTSWAGTLGGRPPVRVARTCRGVGALDRTAVVRSALSVQ